jgi:hypothetical protein
MGGSIRVIIDSACNPPGGAVRGMRAVPTLNFERAEGASVAPRPSALAKPNDLKPLQKLLIYLASSRFPLVSNK